VRIRGVCTNDSEPLDVCGRAREGCTVGEREEAVALEAEGGG